MVDIYIGAAVAATRRLYASAVESHPPTLVIKDLLSQHAQAIHTARPEDDEAVVFHLGSWSPALVGRSPKQIMSAKLSLNDTCECIAREYGFEDWQNVLDLGDKQLDAAFESAVELVITGDVDALRDRLKANPELTQQRSRYGHASTLLHYVGANGVESHRQITPLNCVDVVLCLLEHGADVNAHANMYGGGSTTLMLVLSSAHPANAGVAAPVAAVLKKAGAID